MSTYSATNPYLSDAGEPRLRNSVLAFIDILGYSEMISQAATPELSRELLGRLHATLSENRTWIDFESTISSQLLLPKTYQVAAFTDNIVIAYPIRDDAESELGHALSTLADYQLNMILTGRYFVRGGIAIGDAFVDNFAVFGQALIEAHQIEATVAQSPRIVLTPGAAKIVRKHLGYYAKARSSPQAQALLLDADGKMFLNYLNAIFTDGEQPDLNALEQHKLAIESQLLKHRADPSIFGKYQWVGTYHNFFCETHNRLIDQKYLIDMLSYLPRPRFIYD